MTDETKSDTPSPPTACSVPYHEISLVNDENIKLVHGRGIALNEGRSVEAFRAVGTDGNPKKGIYFRITRTLPDGRVSLLEFRLMDDAARALAFLIVEKTEAPNARNQGLAPQGETP